MIRSSIHNFELFDKVLTPFWKMFLWLEQLLDSELQIFEDYHLLVFSKPVCRKKLLRFYISVKIMKISILRYYYSGYVFTPGKIRVKDYSFFLSNSFHGDDVYLEIQLAMGCIPIMISFNRSYFVKKNRK